MSTSRTFNGTNQYLSRTANAAIQSGDHNWWVCAWGKFAGTTADTLVSAWDGNARGFILTKVTGTTFRLDVGNGAGTSRAQVNLAIGTIPLTRWHLVFGWYDKTANTINIKVANLFGDTWTGTPVTPSGALGPSSELFTVGANWSTSAINFFQGSIAKVAFGKNNTETFSNIFDLMFNSGLGVIYDDLSGAQKTAIGLGGLWNLDEITASDDALDVHNGLDLTPTNDPVPVAYNPHYVDRAVLVASETSGGLADWKGRPILCERDNVWSLIYLSGPSHAESAFSELHIIFSDDEGATWTAPNENLNASAVTGFPIVEHSGTGIGDFQQILCPNGHLVLIVRERIGSPGWNNYQYRSTDGGSTWTDEGLLGTPWDDEHRPGLDYCTVDSTIYLTVIEQPDAVHKAVLFKSEDNCVTWEHVSDISSFADASDIEANETAIEHVGGNNFVAVSRTTQEIKTIQRTSSDLGATWSSPAEIQDAVGPLQTPRMRKFGSRLFLAARQRLSEFVQYNSINYSDDDGATWQEIIPLDLITYVDAGYVTIGRRSDGSLYLIAMAGTDDVADVTRHIINDAIAPIEAAIDFPFVRYYMGGFAGV